MSDYEAALSAVGSTDVDNLQLLVEFTSEQLRANLRSAEIIPNELDRNIPTWLIRLRVWGKVRFFYSAPSGSIKKLFMPRKSISEKEFLDIVMNDDFVRMFGRWRMVKDDFNRMHFSREFYKDGKKMVENVFVEVELKPSLAKAVGK